MDNLISFDDFYSALEEVDILVNEASINEGNDKYPTFNKSAIVLMCTKFEAFIEGVLEEYASWTLLNVFNNALNDGFKLHLENMVLTEIDKTKVNKAKKQQNVRKLLELHGEDRILGIMKYKFDNNFNYGKHGSKELIKLLTKFGIESILDDDFKSKFDGLNGIRNNIIHQDSTPTLTHIDVHTYMLEFKGFAYKVNNILKSHMRV